MVGRWPSANCSDHSCKEGTTSDRDDRRNCNPSVACRIEKAQLVGTDSRSTKYGQPGLTDYQPKMAITQNSKPSAAYE
jgi:hypothetical protein